MTAPQSNTSEVRRLLAFYEELHAELAAGGKPDLARYVARYEGSAEEVARAVLEALSGETAAEGRANVPARLGPYILGPERGRGGQAIVYEAEDPRLRRSVALKVITGLGPGAEIVLRRFRREAEAASRLDHPGICPVFDVGVEGGAAYIAMRLLDGETLSDRLARERNSRTALSSSDASRRTGELLTIFEKTARALHAAHEAGITHRDVKPANIMITASGEPVLLDFGLAHADDAGPTLTQTGDVFGTPAYMAPEQISGHTPADARTDVWALGASLFEAFALRPPFAGATRQALASAILETDAPDLRSVAPSVPADLRAVVALALDRDPNRRYRTALEFAEDVRRVREGEPPLARPATLFGRWLRRARRRPFTAVLVILLMLAVPALGVLLGVVVASRPAVVAAERDKRVALLEREIEIGHAAILERDLDEARAAFDRAMALDPDSEDAVGGRVMVDYVARDWTAALERAQNSSLFPSSEGLKTIAAGCLRGLGRSEEADVIAKGARAGYDPFSCFVRSFAALLREDGTVGSPTAKDAVAEAWRAIAVAPKPRRISFHQLAFAAAMAADEPSARAAASALRAHWRPTPQSEHAVGHALENFDLDAARIAYTNALEMRPDWEAVCSDLVKLERRCSHLPAAIRAAEAAFRIRPTSGRTAANLGEVYALSGRFDEAIAMMNAACDAEPQDQELAFSRAVVLRQAWRLSEAEAALRKVLESQPRSARALSELAVTVRYLGRYAEALDLMRQSRDIGDRTPQLAALTVRRLEALEKLVARSEALEEVLRDAELAESLEHDELSEMAQLASEAGYFHAKYRFLQQDMRVAAPVGASRPTDFVPDSRRLTCASAALQAAFGDGRDAPADAAVRAELRSQALMLLERAVDSERAVSGFQRELATREVLDFILIGGSMQYARAIPGLTALPASEREAWAALLRRCETLRDGTPPNP